MTGFFQSNLFDTYGYGKSVSLHRRRSLCTSDLSDKETNILSCEVKFSALFIFLEQATR